MKSEKRVLFSFHMVLAMLVGLTTMSLADMETAPRSGTNNNNEGRAPRRWAQPNERMARPPVGERLIDRLLANDKLTAEIGLRADTVVKLRAELQALQTQKIEIDAQIDKLSLDQTSRMSGLLRPSGVNTNEVMKTVEEIGRLRTEQAKLAVQNLLIVRKYLTPDQIRKARDLMREQQQNNKDGEARPAKKESLAPTANPPPPAKPPEG